MFDLIFNKDDSFFSGKNLASARGVHQENDAKIRFEIHPQEIWQFHDNCKIVKCLLLPHRYQSRFLHSNISLTRAYTVIRVC